jgi:MFS family permease
MILSVSPFVFMVVRLFFAAFADQIGTKLFFIINSLSHATSKLIYFLANSPIAFCMGKTADGITNSSFWAVSRTEIYLQSTAGKEKESAALLSGIRRAGTAFGMISAGILLSAMSFSSTLLFLFFISLFLLVPSSLLRSRSGKISLHRTFSLLDLRKKSYKFWVVALAMTLYGAAAFSLFEFFPIFMKVQFFLIPRKIGELFAIFYLISTISTFVGLKFKLSILRIVFFQILFLSLSTFLIPFSTLALFPFFFLILAVGNGFSLIIFEKIIADATSGLQSTSTDIGILHIPQRLSEFVTVFAAGFLIERFGFFSIFAISGFSFLLFSIFSYLILKRRFNKKYNKVKK